MTNPIVSVRLANGLSRREFALRLGIDYHDVVICELGYVKRVRKGLADAMALHLGVDGEKLQSEYSEWRAEQRGGESIAV